MSPRALGLIGWLVLLGGAAGPSAGAGTTQIAADATERSATTERLARESQEAPAARRGTTERSARESPVGREPPAGVRRGVKDEAAAAIDACTGKLDPEFDVGYERIAGRCPELPRRLEESGWSVWLPPDWQQPGNNLSAGSLIELRVLVERELAAHPRERAPQVEHLHPVLAALRQVEPERESRWEQLKSWVREAFTGRGLADDDSELSRMVAALGLSETLIEAVCYVALALVVILALLILGNELRSAGVLRRPWRWPPRIVAGPVMNVSEPLGWRDVESADFERKPVVLLEIIIAQLTEQDSLPRSRGLTVRELIRMVRLRDESDRERFAALASVVESLQFSDRPVAPASIQAALGVGRELLQSLGAGPAVGHP